MPKLDLDSIEQINRTGYPSPWREQMAKRRYRRLAPAAGLTDFGAFPKGVANGHQLVNRSGAPCVFIAIGRPAASDCHYPDIDLHLDGASNRYTRKDGTPYETGVS